MDALITFILILPLAGAVLLLFLGRRLGEPHAGYVASATVTVSFLLAAIGAPSSLAVQFAKEFDMTLIGFLNSQEFTVYHDPGRIQN